jgi:hypothetical protein
VRRDIAPVYSSRACAGWPRLAAGPGQGALPEAWPVQGDVPLGWDSPYA